MIHFILLILSLSYWLPFDLDDQKNWWRTSLSRFRVDDLIFRWRWRRRVCFFQWGISQAIHLIRHQYHNMVRFFNEPQFKDWLQGPDSSVCRGCSCTCQFWATGACTRQFLAILVLLCTFSKLLLTFASKNFKLSKWKCDFYDQNVSFQSPVY